MYFTIQAASGGYRAYIKANNNEILFWSEVYTTKASALHAIQIVQNGAGGASTYE
jgi:uncharacterized protein YegP (UPF0339 family)